VIIDFSQLPLLPSFFRCKRTNQKSNT